MAKEVEKNIMNIFFRVLLAIYAFCLMVLSAFMMVVTVKSTYLEIIYNYFRSDVLQNRGSAVIAFIIAFIFFVLSLVFLLSGLKSNRDKKAVSKYTNIGEVRISLNTIESIALATSKRISGVKETKANVLKAEEGVSIAISIVVLPEINIPELSASMQERVKKAVEEISGVSVSDVKVVVENIYTGAAVKSRVE